MRKIKFNGWDTVRKIMYSAEEMGQDELTINPDGRGFVNVNGSYTNSSQYMTHIIPLEYIGLKDKNLKEIHDGDIVDIVYGKHYNEPMGLRRIGCVKYCNKTASFVIKINNSKVEIYFCDSRTKDIEVIGNIYSNPELLKKE